MQLHPIGSDSLEHSATVSKNAALLTSMVPFEWEEVPGKPRTPATTPSADEMMPYDHQLALHLPPKLQFQLHQSPLCLPPSPYQSPSPLHHHNHDSSHQSSPLSLSRVSPITHQKLKSLYKYMHRAASGNWPRPSQSWVGYAFSCASPSSQHKLTTMNEPFFTDKSSPQAVKYGVCRDDWKPLHLPPLQDFKSRGAHESLSFLAMEDQETESTASSPWHPIQFHDREHSDALYHSTSIKSLKFQGGHEDHARFHDSFSTAASSLEKPSDRAMEIACQMESACLSSAWFLDFSPEEETVHEGKRRSKLLVATFVALINLKNFISRNVCRLRGRREEASDQQAFYTSIWSPTLATYLYHNELREERDSSSPSLHYLSLEDEEDDDRGADLPSSLSVASSHGFHINPEYPLPSSILRGHLQMRNDFLEGGDSSSFRVHGLGKSGSSCFSRGEEEEGGEGIHKLKKHRLSLREHLAEFDDEYLLQPALINQSSPPQMLVSSNEREPTPCKRACKARKTVKILVATIKLILVQSEDGKRLGQRRPPLKYGGCLRPTLSTRSSFPSSHR